MVRPVIHEAGHCDTGDMRQVWGVGLNVGNLRACGLIRCVLFLCNMSVCWLVRLHSESDATTGLYGLRFLDF